MKTNKVYNIIVRFMEIFFCIIILANIFNTKKVEFDKEQAENLLEELVIKETWMISGEINKRSNYFIKNENGQWILDHFSGTSRYGFGDISCNPWNLNRE